MADDAEARRWKRQRRRRYFSGLMAERVAATWLMFKGYRVLGRRVRTAGGEIDLIAVRGRRLAFVEVKQRRNVGAAQASIQLRQRQRVRRAAELWLSKRRSFENHDVGFDVVFLVPWRWPLHIQNGLSDHELR
ncbi:conserved protein of unknown function [Candidatus Filomicrobium marinum]|uniref:UPF0102 protein YBN1229_v1_0847 n=1 Tax=Candidatus Filomicrobium marinum TaxID=1608628 RepID=A0A0D6JBR4_9HYPH|nr:MULTISPECIES: YraN family protein [Filomicrobium]MCV0370672.1 YraN family protein [Filomicrobium sp.]CFX06945.1 conserved protein of unknown function [Candidatus Filomicrobium marinum]CPR16521.1 conserved protein of unknown function [Candidatus Filomicrobium marinum]